MKKIIVSIMFSFLVLYSLASYSAASDSEKKSKKIMGEYLIEFDVFFENSDSSGFPGERKVDPYGVVAISKLEDKVVDIKIWDKKSSKALSNKSSLRFSKVVTLPILRDPSFSLSGKLIDSDIGRSELACLLNPDYKIYVSDLGKNKEPFIYSKYCRSIIVNNFHLID